MLKVLRFKALEVHVKSFPFESYCSTANLHVSRLQCRQRDTISDNHTFFHHFLYLEPSKNNEWKIVLKDHLESLTVPPTWEFELKRLQHRIGITFQDQLHLQCACIHFGYFSDEKLISSVPAHRLSNRSLEFLGDSILNFVVASYLFQRNPMYSEGKLTMTRSCLVNNEVLAKICVENLKLHRCLLVATEYEKYIDMGDIDEHDTAICNTARIKGMRTIKAGAVEALIAAIYVDQGLEKAIAFVNEQVIPSACEYGRKTPENPVRELQELLQKYGKGHPVYRRLPAPDNSETLVVELRVEGRLLTSMSGRSYREARLEAAKKGLEIYHRELQ
ncbi:unnamed protein product [Albugo candida]|uniref:RNase III domain-containing protein n=1 Tax=Albugo candida TaxID=65357 RepID=A0A024GFQ5_9STRA|nr:unnamed protein product [Albugo candida]|eukprot:CCI45711.1 unnamed protein product [Albugo candida]